MDYASCSDKHWLEASLRTRGELVDLFGAPSRVGSPNHLGIAIQEEASEIGSLHFDKPEFLSRFELFECWHETFQVAPPSMKFDSQEVRESRWIVPLQNRFNVDANVGFSLQQES